ncbi:MAG TPA: hypothetical protein VGN88_05325 [Phycisphaerae bacterium]
MGLGHLLPLKAIAVQLVSRGHRVIMAVRELEIMGKLFEGTGISFIPCPIYTNRGQPPFPETLG